MASQDDPEARIRELERSLNDRASELGTSSSEIGSGQYGYSNSPAPPPPGSYATPYPPPPPGSYGQTYPPPPPGSYGTPPSFSSGSGITFPTLPSKSSGFRAGPLIFVVFAVVGIGIAGAAFVFFRTASSISDFSTNFPSISVNVPSPSLGSVVPTATAGAPISVAGAGEHKKVVCDGGEVTISGVSNTVEITGTCAKLTVSGMQNKVTVESADTIGASGFNNEITYHSGTPTIENSGDNVVEQG